MNKKIILLALCITLVINQIPVPGGWKVTDPKTFT
jgi:hypothetical protein